MDFKPRESTDKYIYGEESLRTIKYGCLKDPIFNRRYFDKMGEIKSAKID